MQIDIITSLRDAQHRTENAKEALRQYSYDQAAVDSAKVERDIYEGLSSVSQSLADSYAQVKRDIQDNTRVSWAGTAHEIREIVATMLRLMASDELVKAQPWYRQEQGTNGPSQKQRVHYIMQQHSAGSKEREAVQQVSSFEDLVGNVVRATYSRASDAAHTYKGRREVIRILHYFETFARDLLNLD